MLSFSELFGLAEDPANLAELPTMFGRTQVYDAEDDDGTLLRVLDVDGSWQSASYLGERWSELAFGYHRVFNVALSMNPRATRALVLGGGAFSYPKYLLTHQPQLHVDVVEIDPAINELAQQWFFLDRLSPAERMRLNAICEDAPTYLASYAERAETGDAPRYDLIVNDLFAAEMPTAALMKPAGLAQAKRALAPDGIYVANVVSALKGKRAKPLREVVGALMSTFSDVRVIPLSTDEPRVPDNNVVLAWCGPYAAPGSSFSPEELALA